MATTTKDKGYRSEIAGAIYEMMSDAHDAGVAAQRGLGESAAYLDGLRWAFGLCTLLAIGMLALVATLPARVATEHVEPVAVHV